MTKEIPLDKQIQIVELSLKEMFRSDIAKETNTAEKTVYKYQKKFNLV